MDISKETPAVNPKRRIRSISRWLLLTAAVGTSFAFILLMGSSSYRNYQESIKQSAVSHDLISGLLGAQISGGLRWKKEDSVLAVFDAAVSTADENSLSIAQVYDAEGVLWMEYIPDSSDEQAAKPDEVFLSAHVNTETVVNELVGSIYTVVVPVLSGKANDRIGSLVTVWDFNNKRARTIQILLSETYIAMILLAILLLSLWLVVGRLVVKPLRNITAQMSQLAAGDTSIEIVGQARRDEIGSIAAAVNVFKQDALNAIAVAEQQNAIEQEAEQQRELALSAESEKQAEQKRQIEEERTRSEQDAQASLSLSIRIERLLSAVNAASEGNLNYPIEDDNVQDDLNKIALALENMFSELRTSFSDIGKTAGELSASAAALNNLGQNISSVASDSAMRTTEASETTIQVSASVGTVASATQEMGASIKQISANATDAAQVADRAVKLAESTDASVRELAESSSSIGNVIKVITSIAEQTNLLALNATIEAARAGDAGKGFAVVANEVKELAKETANATEEIEKRIASIQTGTGVAVDAIRDINTIVKQISETQNTIAVAVEEQTATTHEISKTVNVASLANEEIGSVMEGVVEQSETTRLSAAEVEAAASRLGELAVSLETLVERYQYREAA